MYTYTHTHSYIFGLKLASNSRNTSL